MAGPHLLYDFEGRKRRGLGPHLSYDADRRSQRLPIVQRWFEILFHIVRLQLGHDVVKKEPVVWVDFYRDVLLIYWNSGESRDTYQPYAEIACRAVGISYCLGYTPDDQKDPIFPRI
jgi:hypothetical protein